MTMPLCLFPRAGWLAANYVSLVAHSTLITVVRKNPDDLRPSRMIYSLARDGLARRLFKELISKRVGNEHKRMVGKEED